MTTTIRTPSTSLARSALALVLTALACNSVLGIEDASVDPTLGMGGGASGGSAGSGDVKGGAAGSLGGKSGETGGGGSPSTSGGGLNERGGSAGQAGAVGVAGDSGVGGDAAEGGAAQGGEGGSGGAPPTGSLCEQYCDTITAFCAGPALQYKDREQCLRVCDMFPQGALGDPDGNSVACRVKYAGKARYAGGTELTAYCRQAGPGGDGRCGADCDGFCAITMATCSAAATAPYYFSSGEACQTTCRSLPDIPYVYGDVTVADGNSVQCRLFHVISAAMADPEEHCEHVLGLTLCEQ
jgi:hypothetical protein